MCRCFALFLLGLAGCQVDPAQVEGRECDPRHACPAPFDCVQGICRDNGEVAPRDDRDGDGLSDDEEATRGTDPDARDTDGDGLADGEEVILRDTSPLEADTDGDQLSDGVEVLLIGTSPTNRDSDGDAIADGAEDSDGDYLINFDEVVIGTDPHDQDTDGDGIIDGTEKFGWTGYLTDPLDPDTDDDGRNDLSEIIDGTDPTTPD